MTEHKIPIDQKKPIKPEDPHIPIHHDHGHGDHHDHEESVTEVYRIHSNGSAERIEEK